MKTVARLLHHMGTAHLMCAMWPWERHNVSEPPFSHIKNVANTCLIYFIISCEERNGKTV